LMNLHGRRSSNRFTDIDAVRLLMGFLHVLVSSLVLMNASQMNLCKSLGHRSWRAATNCTRDSWICRTAPQFVTTTIS
jgi:hypothetical protein